MKKALAVIMLLSVVVFASPAEAKRECHRYPGNPHKYHPAVCWTPPGHRR